MTRRFSAAQDLFELHSVTDPQLSPDGTECLFIKTHIEEEKDDYISNLYHIHLDTEEVTHCTFRGNNALV